MADRKTKRAGQVEDKGWRLAPSPLGYPELTAPFGLGAGGAGLGGVAARNSADLLERAKNLGVPASIIAALAGHYAGDPAVLYPRGYGDLDSNHERIHVGQYLSGHNPYDRNKEPRDMKLFSQLESAAKALGLLPSTLGHLSPVEAPAYNFMNPTRYDPVAFAAFMDDVHKTAPKPAYLEASMPRSMMEQYLKTRPVPYNVKPPTVPIEPVADQPPQPSGFSALLRRLLGGM